MLAIGIVGLPNVGKSTLFNALVKENQAETANFPFCTIEPNVGVVTVPDPRLEVLAKIVGTKTIIPANITFIDIAGLVAGAHTGEGLGNQFLSHIREVDAICMVVRCFNNENILHVSGKPNPPDDIATINLELALADLKTVDKVLAAQEKKAKGGDAEAKIVLATLNKIRPILNDGQPANKVSLTEAEEKSIRSLGLLTTKPIIYLGNVSENQLTADPIELGMPPGSLLISAKIETELPDLSPDEQEDYLTALGLDESGLPRLIRLVYQTLGLQSFFTAGPKEVRAWTIAKGNNAREAAGVIHTDFARGFIKAEVISYQDIVKYGSEAKVKAEGRIRLEGKDYLVQDGDIMLFRFSS